MRAVVAEAPGREGYTVREDIPIPVPGDDEVLISPLSVGVCASDVKMYDGADFYWGKGGRVRGPVIPGHEVFGVVVAKGDVKQKSSPAGNVRVGQHVVVEQGMPCGKCWFCRTGGGHKCDDLRVYGQGLDGGMAEYMLVPKQSMCYAVPESIPPHHASFVEPLVIGVRAVDRAASAINDTLDMDADAVSNRDHLKPRTDNQRPSMPLHLGADATRDTTIGTTMPSWSRIFGQIDSSRASPALESRGMHSNAFKLDTPPRLSPPSSSSEPAVAVVGGCGAIGLGVVAALRYAYGDLVHIVAVDANSNRRALAVKAGANVAVDCNQRDAVELVTVAQAGCMRGGCDVYFECAGHPSSVSQGLELLRKMGTMVHLGVWHSGAAEGANWNLISAMKELNVLGSSLGGSRMSRTWERAIDIIDRGLLPMDDIVTRRFARLEDVHDAYATAQGSDQVKVVFEMPPPPPLSGSVVASSLATC